MSGTVRRRVVHRLVVHNVRLNHNRTTDDQLRHCDGSPPNSGLINVPSDSKTRESNRLAGDTLHTSRAAGAVFTASKWCHCEHNGRRLTM